MTAKRTVADETARSGQTSLRALSRQLLTSPRLLGIEIIQVCLSVRHLGIQ